MRARSCPCLRGWVGGLRVVVENPLGRPLAVSRLGFGVVNSEKPGYHAIKKRPIANTLSYSVLLTGLLISLILTTLQL
eukprot:2029095-Rhodomonas_salina.1